MKYSILLSGILFSGLYGANAHLTLLQQLKLTLKQQPTIATFYDAVRANDTQSIAEHLQSKKPYPLKRLATTAAKYQHKEALFILLAAGAQPPLYETATQGRTDLALLSLKHLSNFTEPLTPLAKERLLKRLSKTGNPKLLHMYFDYGVLKPEDVSHAIVAGATQGSKTYTTLVEKRFMHGTGTCAICITDFTKEETQDPKFLLKCGHMFHKLCSDQWFEKRPTCPLCQKLVRKKKK